MTKRGLLQVHQHRESSCPFRKMAANQVQILVTLYILISLTNCAKGQVISTDTKCKRNYAIDIGEGQLNTNSSITFEGVTYPPSDYYRENGTTFGCICDLRLCISKCCTENHPQNLTCDPGLTTNVKIDTYHDNLTLAVSNVAHVSTHWTQCPFFELEETDAFYIKKDGKLFFPEEHKHYDLHKYCVAQNENRSTIFVRLCVEREDIEDVPKDLHIYGMLISIPFLFATLLVYVILPDKKIQIKCLMAYVTCLMLSYIFLVYLQFNTNLPPTECQAIAACGVYFFMATFCWMNVTCVDMYWTFSGKRPPIRGNSSKWKRFVMYCGFANGAPFILLAIIFGLDSMDPFIGHPQFGRGQCWIAHGLPQLLYFYGPMAILLSINMILFIITAHTIRSTIRDNQKMLRSKESQRHYESNKQDYILYIKLFVAMGINWSMELISWIVDWSLGQNKVSWIWYPTDFCNAIYGIFIFIIFVCKRTVWIKLKHRYYVFMGKPHMARALSAGTSGYQMSQTERTNMDESSVANNYSEMKLNQM